MTTKDAIKQLPIDDDLKLQVLTMYDYMDDEQKLTIERIAWNTYDFTREATIRENVEKQLEKVEHGEAELSPDFYSDVVKESEQDLTKASANASSSMDLAVARRAMQQIVKEMQDAKDIKAAKKLHSKKG